jgi:hypothetical protein
LNSVDLPTFGRPTMASFNGKASALLKGERARRCGRRP